MGFGRYRFRRSFGQVKSQFRGARPKFYPLFTGLLDTYAGAVAAYSLRRLSKIASSVVRVRRASDNAEKDFTADDITDNSMVNWVNGQIVPPLDIRELDSNGERTGDLVEAAAAYSLRNLSASYTGNVVDVRRSSDDAEESFTAAEVADGTLEDWVLGDDESLVDDAQYFNGTNSEVVTTGLASAIGTQDFKVSFSLGAVATSGRILQMGDAESHTANNGFFISLTSSGTFTIGVDQTFLTTTIARKANGGSYDVVFDRSGDAEVFEDGVSIGTVDISSKSGISLLNKPLFIGARDVTSAPLRISGVIYNISIDIGNDGTPNNSYTGKGATPWDDTIGSNDGTPSNLVTFTGQGYDGFVSQWYDQSGNDNHATQGTDASQPKIVDGGSLVSGGIEFDGVNDRLTCSSLYSSDISVFNVVTTSNTVNTGNYMRMIHLCDGSDSFQITRGGTTDIGKLISKNTAFQSGTTSFLHGDINGENLISAITSSTDTDAFVDGSLQSSSSASIVGSGNNATTTIGARDDLVSSTFFAGSHAELIIYDSDQSDNRTAIEANIGDHYDIDLPSGVDTGYDQVDGFVETWYDQSGNGNDAVQQVAGSQPKIVDAGALVEDANGKPEIVFDGSYDWLDLGVSQLGNTEFFADSSDSWFTTAVATYGTGTLISKASSSFNLREFQIFGDGSENYVNLRGTYSDFGNITNQRLVSFNWDGSNAVAGLNGGSTTATVGSASKTNQNINIGARTDGQFLLNGSIQEIIIYDSDQSANRAAIEANINNQYDIY